MINRFILLWSLFLFASTSNGQMMVEDCANSLDDDADGLIDLNDPDCKCKGIKDSFFVLSSLIPNPSFEDYILCPTGLMQLDSLHCKYWRQASAATSDYYNTCGFKEDPFQRGFPPQPLPAGNGYVGFLDLKDYPGQPNKTYKEYVGACLTSPMYPGKEYTLTFWIGFGRPGGVWGPRAITSLGIFGTSKCSNLPFGPPGTGWLCPTAYSGWFLLTSVTASGTNKWVKVKVKIRPTRTIESIVIGPSCTRADGYYYFWCDDLVLEETAKFDSIYLGIQGNPCVDSIQLSSPPTKITKITYQWYYNGVAIPGATSQNYQIPKDQQGKYVLKAIDGADCELSNTYNYNIDSLSSDITQQICNGEIFNIGSNEFTKQGFYRVVIPSANGCDSIVHLDLKVNTPGQGLIDTVICENEFLDIDGVVYDSTGQFQIYTSTTDGCDSLTILNLKVTKTVRNELYVFICEGQEYIIDQDTLTMPGDYPYQYVSAKNCDSIMTIHLFVNKNVSQIIDTVICEGQIIQAGNLTLDKSGIYFMNLLKTDGCDSALTLNLKVNPTYFRSIDTSFCNGNQMSIGSQVFDKSGIYYLTLPTTESCDSNFEIKLNVLSTHQMFFNNSICEGQSLNFAGNSFSKAGVYDIVINNQFGCDSILTLNLIVNPVYDQFLDTAICDNKIIRIGTIDYSKAGNYIQNYSSINLCDSILHINLRSKKSFQQLVDTSICQGYSLQIGSQNFDKSGLFQIGLKTAEGCDSSITLNLNVKPNYTSRVDTVICFDQQIVIGGKIYTNATNFNLQYISTNGCDSSVSVNIKKTKVPDIQIEKLDLQCFGDVNGWIKTILNGSDGPYVYSWSNGQTNPDINQLAAGNYLLSVRDNQDCLIEKQVIISSPSELIFEVDKKDANCLDPDKGCIFITAISGGTPPYKYFMDGRPVSFQNLFESARVGAHDLIMRDSNGCEVKYKLDIEEAFRGYINMQPDSLSVILGDSVWLEVKLNDIDSIASIVWIGPGEMSCKNCLRTSAFITSSSGNFKVTITDNNGCIYVETIYVKSKQVFNVPNVFSPNGDYVNDYFNLITDRSIENIDELHIYDRWGNQLYEVRNFPPNGIDGAWDGTVGGLKALPGVYVYLFLFKDKTGASHKLSGDLTLIR